MKWIGGPLAQELKNKTKQKTNKKRRRTTTTTTTKPKVNRIIE